ncbi:MAG: YggS family pyridoxal phosphate-dependent enzyme [Rhizobiales bacterium TMED94]|nr:YggS family pyridoxal phosphate-dependent enzyme [Rhodobiaceae bacterium]RPF85606.1 MAG: YggS family pyridoxal phosphate-dependent enzyme [Rhizobiales bacterium TMED94]|tara:strand:+ start:406 stop:1116 length:711 start_codon:yes stop_codon:yes gene_type:complete
MILDKINNKDKEAMTDIQKNLETIKNRIEKIAVKFSRDPSEIKLIVVTKKFDFEKIKPLIDAGHLFFGENKVQEAEKKWAKTLSNSKDIELHMVGPIQSNKIKIAINLFTAIHSIEKIKTLKIINENISSNSTIKELFLQVNISQESSKNGIYVEDMDKFFIESKNFSGININGLMTLPPPNEEPSVYFALLNKLSKKNMLKYLSMGMSNDFETAIALGATHIRVGEAIMGPRNKN